MFAPPNLEVLPETREPRHKRDCYHWLGCLDAADAPPEEEELFAGLDRGRLFPSVRSTGGSTWWDFMSDLN